MLPRGRERVARAALRAAADARPSKGCSQAGRQALRTHEGRMAGGIDRSSSCAHLRLPPRANRLSDV